MKTHRPRMRRRARAQRRNPTQTEGRLWRRLRAKKLGAKFRRQHVLAPYIVDFYCPSASLAVEVDGPWHDPTLDARRDEEIARRHGVSTLRFTVLNVEHHIDDVLASIRVAIASAS